MTVGIIVLGYDYDRKHENIGNGSRKRCEAAVELFNELSLHAIRPPIFVMSPGFDPNIERDIQAKPMSAMMRDWIVRKGNVHDEWVYLGNPVWGSRYEVLEGVLTLLEHERLRGRIEQIWVVSHGFHIPRLKRITARVTELLGLGEIEWKFRGVVGSIRQGINEVPRHIGEAIRLPFWNPEIRSLDRK